MLIVTALGVTWLLDGLEVTIVGVLGAVLERPDTLGLTTLETGLVGTIYILGAVIGSLVFGFLSDRLGRKRLYFVTPSIYLLATLLCAASANFWQFAALRCITGFGIGGEYAAMNSAIQELIPARIRGTASLIINGSFWLGAALGAAISLVLLNPAYVHPEFGWRFSFAFGAILGIAILVMRRYLPESPRWLLTHGHAAEAETVVRSIEEQVYGAGKVPPEPEQSLTIRQVETVSLGAILRTLFLTYPKRALLGLALMVSQAFFYNAIFFTYAAVLHQFYGVEDDHVGLFLIPFAIGNFLGPVALGPLFDSWGRKVMITGTYSLSALLLLLTGWLFVNNLLTAITQTVLWSVIFFFSSPAASAAYLTVSEIFPMEIRALAIAVFYSLGTAGGGLAGPALFGKFLEQAEATHSRMPLLYGYVIGSSLMFVAAAAELLLGISAEGKSLEEIARPINAEPAEGETSESDLAAEGALAAAAVVYDMDGARKRFADYGARDAAAVAAAAGQIDLEG